MLGVEALLIGPAFKRQAKELGNEVRGGKGSHISHQIGHAVARQVVTSEIKKLGDLLAVECLHGHNEIVIEHTLANLLT